MPPLNPPRTTGPTGIRELTIALRPGTAPTAAPATEPTGARELEGTRPAMTAGPAAAQVQTTAVARLV